MKHFNRLATFLLTASIIASCTTGNVSPTQESTQPPRDVATAVGSGGPDPNATEPGVRPTETSEALQPTATPEVHVGYGGPLSEQAIKDIEEGDYTNQINGITEWANYWYPNGSVGSESTLNVGFLEDQNGQLLAGIDGGDFWLFPPVVNGTPVYEGAPAAGSPLMENFDPFRVNKVITEQQALDQGYDAEMAKYLADSAAELRSGMLVRVKNGKAIAYVGLQSRRWEKVPEMPFVSSDAQAQSCKIREDEAALWFITAKLNDNTGRFGNSVIHWPLGESHILGGPASPAHVYWNANEQNSNPWEQFADPNVSPFKRVVYCSVDRGSWAETIRLVKYLNPSGHISWLIITGPGGGDGRKGDFPIFPEDNPAIAKPLHDWAASQGQQDFPKELEGKLLREVY